MELRQTTLVVMIIIVVATTFVVSRGQQTNGLPNCALPPSHKIDEYGAIERLEESTHLEKLLLALGTKKDAHAFIVTYGRSSLKGEAQQRADWAKRYLVEKHVFYGVAEGTNAHINTVTCGYRDASWTELWIHARRGGTSALCADKLRPNTAKIPGAS